MSRIKFIFIINIILFLLILNKAKAVDITIIEKPRFQLADSLKNFDFYITGIDSNGIESFVVIDSKIRNSDFPKIKMFNDKFMGSDISLVRLPNKNRQKLFNICKQTISSSIELEKDYVKRPTDEVSIIKLLETSALTIHWYLNSNLELDRFFLKFKNIQENKEFIFLDFQVARMLSKRTFRLLSDGFNSSKNYTIDDKTAILLLKENEERLNDLFNNKQLGLSDSTLLKNLRKGYLQLKNKKGN